MDWVSGRGGIGRCFSSCFGLWQSNCQPCATSRLAPSGPLRSGRGRLERGSLESQSSIDLICEVEDVRKDNINGTTILWMIPNGASVKKGDLIVELDSNPMQEALDEQLLYTENALAEKIQAEANLKNQLTMNATAQAEAELLIKLAELELEMFTDSENGTHNCLPTLTNAASMT